MLRRERLRTQSWGFAAMGGVATERVLPTANDIHVALLTLLGRSTPRADYRLSQSLARQIATLGARAR
jgi:hypothetical protein